MDDDMIDVGYGTYMSKSEFEEVCNRFKDIYSKRCGTPVDLVHNYPFYCCDECYEKECKEHGELEVITITVLKEFTSCVICGKPASATRLCRKA